MITLGSLVFIMVTGAAVRLTGSGLGCSTWPQCEPDSITPRSASDAAGMVEFGNRIVTGLVGLFTLAAVLGARWRSPRRDDLYRWALGLPAWVMANALVGALVVWLHLAPVSVIGHFLLSLGALWNAVVLYQKAGEDARPGTPRRDLAVPSLRRACNLLILAAGLTLVSGTVVTGSGPHAGDEEAARLSFDVENVARIHGLVVVAFAGLALVVWQRARSGDAEASVEARLRLLVVVLAGQAAVGYTQYFTGVPALLVGIHVFGSATVWLAVLWVRLGLSTPVRPGEAPSRPGAVAETAPTEVATESGVPAIH